MAVMDPAIRLQYRRALSRAQETVRKGVCAGSDSTTASHWRLWVSHCKPLGIDPLLTNMQDPVQPLQVFAELYRDGTLAPSRDQVRARTVEGAVRSIGQTIASVGAPDPRYTVNGKIDFRLRRMWAAWGKEDPPPHRVKPIPVSIVRHVASLADAANTPRMHAIADMIILAFYFLLRPGEYTASSSSTTPFALEDVQLFVGTRRLRLFEDDVALFRSVTFCTLVFTTQKNGVRGEVIGLGRSGHIAVCPVNSLVRRVLHLRAHNAPPRTPLAVYYTNGNTTGSVTAANITTALRSSARLLGAMVGFSPGDVSARSLRAGGAMSLMCAGVDSDVIQLMGRWRSDEMMKYLHIQAAPVMRNFAKRMYNAGSFSLIPNPQSPELTVPLH